MRPTDFPTARTWNTQDSSGWKLHAAIGFSSELLSRAHPPYTPRAAALKLRRPSEVSARASSLRAQTSKVRPVAAVRGRRDMKSWSRRHAPAGCR